jgi:hypothetical protein
MPPKRFTSREAIVAFQRALRERVVALPGVSETGAITLPPLSGLISRVPFAVEGRAVERERVPIAQFRTVTAGYFETVRIPVKRGRTFSDRDTGAVAPVAIVNETLAERWLSGLEPIGARLLDAAGQTRTKDVELSRLGSDTLESGRYDVVSIRLYANGTMAVMNGHGHLVWRSPNGTTRKSDYYSFNVFEKRNGEWKYVAAFLP